MDLGRSITLRTRDGTRRVSVALTGRPLAATEAATDFASSAFLTALDLLEATCR